jgi:hypothetical protein
MLKPSHTQRFVLLSAFAGLAAVANLACLEDVCAPDQSSGAFTTMNDVMKNRIQTLDDGLRSSGVTLSDSQRAQLARDGQLLGVVKLDRPVKHPNGKIEMPAGWLPELSDSHPWRQSLTPSDDAFYSYVEERIIKAKLFDPENAEHLRAAEAYLQKVNSKSPQFTGWTAIGGRTECRKRMYDAAGVGVPG